MKVAEEVIGAAVGGAPCGLAACLSVCLLDLQMVAPHSAVHLSDAIARLKRHEALHDGGMNDIGRPDAVAPFLRFLLPEIEAKSPAAARAVRSALRALQSGECPPQREAFAPLH